MRYGDELPKQPRRVRVAGRDDIGEVIQEGKNFGTRYPIYCAVVYFPETGEVAFYDMKLIQTVTD